MNLLDLIPPWATACSVLLAFVAIYLLLRRGVMRSIVDPATPALFQLTFTFFILTLTGLLQASDSVGMFLFLGIVALFPPGETPPKQIVMQEDWLAFSKCLALLLLIMNAYLAREKGLLFMSDDVLNARLEFFQGWGIFRRFNEAGIGIMTITAALLWERRSRKIAVLFALLAAAISLTLGSRSSLMACLFAYGTYLHFAKRRVSNASLIAVGIALSSVTLAIFYLMYGVGFFVAFAYRLLAECDGPFYFFYDRMYTNFSVPWGYPLDILATSLRFRSAPIYTPLGEAILYRHFGIDILQGPNPQIFVESHVLFQSFGLVWYLICAGLFVCVRHKAHNPYSFFFAMFFLGPLLIDSQYGFSQLFTVMLIYSLLGFFLALRWLLATAASRTYWKETM